MTRPDASHHPTFCRICEAACGLQVELAASGQPVHVRPDRQHPVSRGFVCAKGTRFLEVADHPDRLLYPLRRGADGQYERVSWPEAMAWMAQRLRPILDRYGPHAVGIYFGNPLAFNTMGALTMLGFMRALGTRNVFTAGSQDCNNKFAGAQMVHGSPLIHPLPDFEHAEVAILLGTNPAVSQTSFLHLEGGGAVFDRMVQRGGRLIWVDPRRTESAQRWGEHVPIRPGTDVFLLLTLLHALRERYQPDTRVEGLAPLLALAAAYPLARAADLTGIPQARLEEIAATIRHADRATFHMSVGVNQGPFGTLCYVALQALMYLSGNCDRRGGVLFHPLAVWLGEIAQRCGVGYSSARSRVGNFASVLASLPAGILADEIMTPGPEQIRALLVVAGNPLTSVPGEAQLRQAFGKLDVCVSIDMFRNATSQKADVLLPSTSWLERGDVAATTALFQHSPLIQYTRPVRPGPGETRSETRILADLSLALGRPLFGSKLLAQAWGRMPWDTVLAILAGLGRLLVRWRYPRVLAFPSPRPKPGRYLGRGPRTPGRRMRFWHPDLEGERQRLERHTAVLHPYGEAFTLICRRRRLGHNSWLHGAVSDGNPEAAAWMAPGDLVGLGLPDGGTISLQTASACVQLPALPVVEITLGTVVVPHGLPGANVNALIPSSIEQLEPMSGQHWMTGLPVRITRVL